MGRRKADLPEIHSPETRLMQAAAWLMPELCSMGSGIEQAINIPIPLAGGLQGPECNPLAITRPGGGSITDAMKMLFEPCPIPDPVWRGWKQKDFGQRVRKRENLFPRYSVGEVRTIRRATKRPESEQAK